MLHKCCNCVFWEFRDEINGVCHRYAPRPTITQGKEGARNFIIVWAMTRKDDWCGDFAKAPNINATEVLAFDRNEVKANA